MISYSKLNKIDGVLSVAFFMRINSLKRRRIRIYNYGGQCMRENHADGFNEYKESVFPLKRPLGEVHENGQEGIRGISKTDVAED